MNLNLKHLLASGALAAALLGGSACEQTKDNTATAANQTTTRAEQDLAELREWLDQKTNDPDSTNSERGEKVREEFKQRSAQLDAKLDSLSVQSKEEYKELRRKYQNWEIRNQQRSMVPLYPETMQRFQQELLGSSTALEGTITAGQMRAVYEQFLQNVRARRASWTSADWDYVDEVYRQINQKKDQVEDAITAKDKLKIKALQTEFLTLETGKDAKELYKELKK